MFTDDFSIAVFIFILDIDDVVTNLLSSKMLGERPTREGVCQAAAIATIVMA